MRNRHRSARSTSRRTVGAIASLIVSGLIGFGCASDDADTLPAAPELASTVPTSTTIVGDEIPGPDGELEVVEPPSGVDSFVFRGVEYEVSCGPLDEAVFRADVIGEATVYGSPAAVSTVAGIDPALVVAHHSADGCSADGQVAWHLGFAVEITGPARDVALAALADAGL